MDAYISSVALRTNEVMRVLTIMSTIFIPSTLHRRNLPRDELRSQHVSAQHARAPVVPAGIPSRSLLIGDNRRRPGVFSRRKRLALHHEALTRR